MRIAVGGFMHESNTFSLQRTSLESFRAGNLQIGHDLIPVWKEAHHELGGFLEGAALHGFEVIPTVMAGATPSGPVDDDVLDVVVDHIATACRRERVDGLLLALHGAMVTPSFLDADGEVLGRLRRDLGPDLPVVVSLDFHGNVSHKMVRHATALLGYQTYPHVDQRTVGLHASDLIHGIIRENVRPVSAIAKPPLILNLLAQETDREPMRSLMTLAREFERRPGILSVSLMAGFPYADVPEMGPAVIVVADQDQSLARETADSLARSMWDFRHELDVTRPAAEEAVQAAIASESGPIVLVDLGDNIGGGTPGDGTILLAELIRQRARNAVVVLHDPPGVEAATAAGTGSVFAQEVGGRTRPDLYGPPIRVSGLVHSLHEGTWIENMARHGGLRHNAQGPTAVVELPGPIWLVLNSLRTPPFSLGQLTSIGLDPRSLSILVAKAAVAYKAAYAPIARRIIEVDTPGLTALDPRRFAYLHARRPIFPLDPECPLED